MKKTAGIVALAALTASASADIRITEIWAGGLDGSEMMADWFEVTNEGAAAFDMTGVFFDDSSNDPTENSAVAGIASIAPGESAIVLVSWEGDWATSGDAINAFTSVWGAGNIAGVQIGYVDDGAGLGGGGDAVYLYDGNTGGATTLASAEYTTDTQLESFIYNPVSGAFGEYAQVGVFGAFESDLPATDEPGIGSAIGSPGLVPTPGSAMLLGLGGLAVARRRR